MNEEKKIAQAILDAQNIHEDSWKDNVYKRTGSGYTKQFEKCL
jgi:hypothetical protein